MTDPATNQRRVSRVPFAASVHLIGSAGSTVVQLLDISLKGALVSRPADWSVDAGTALALELILVDNVYIRANVKVAHSAGMIIPMAGTRYLKETPKSPCATLERNVKYCSAKGRSSPY